MPAIQTQTLIQPGEVVNGGVLKQTPVNARFDLAAIAPHIADAERAHLIPIIGAEFYADLVAEKSGAVSNYNTAVGAVVEAYPTNGPYETLWINHLLPICAWAVYYEMLPFIAVQVGTNGAFVNNTEYSNNTGLQGAKALQDASRRRIEIKAEALKTYLCANATDYPLYTCPDTDTNCTDGESGTKIGTKTYRSLGFDYLRADV